jgi:hypothetical protein
MSENQAFGVCAMLCEDGLSLRVLPSSSNGFLTQATIWEGAISTGEIPCGKSMMQPSRESC